MILSDILLVKRVDGFFYVEDFKIKADRISSPGYGVLLVFEPSLHLRGRFAWFPTTKALDIISQKLDLSDHLTLDLHQGKGWDSGPRPFSKKLVDMI